MREPLSRPPSPGSDDVGCCKAESLDAPDESHLTLRQAATGGEGAPAVVTERLVSHLLRTRCPVTVRLLAAAVRPIIF